MSFINYHKSPKIILRATPAFVRGWQWPNQNTVDYTVTAPLQAVAGNFMIIQITGNNARTYTVTPNASWTLIAKYNTPVLCHIWYKFAGPSEPLVIPITFSGAMTGGVTYWEFTNIDPGNPYLASGAFNNSVAALSHVNLAFNLLKSKSLVMYDIALAVATTTWVVDNSTTAYNLITNGIRKDGFRVYTDFVHASQITTWSSPSDNRVGVGSWSIFNGKPVNYA